MTLGAAGPPAWGATPIYITADVPTTETALIQEVHSVLVHLISEIVESSLAQQSIERTRIDEAGALP